MNKKIRFLHGNYKSSYFNWMLYTGIIAVLAVMGIVPTLWFGGLEFLASPAARKFLIWYLLYGLVVTGTLSLLMAYQKFKLLDMPMNRLSEAMEKVSQGDFSVHLSPLHKKEHRDYIDDLFDDFNRMVEELASIETLKTDFIADVSHEIKTPLAIIQNYITAMQEKDIPKEKKRQYMDAVVESTQRLTEMVSNILKLNKLENQKLLPAPKSYNLGRQLADCILSFEPLINQKDIEIQASIEENIIVCVDESFAEIIWNNILSNALKFTECKGKICITQWTENEHTIAVRISDNGCGMDEETKRHVFEKFYQGDSSHSTQGNGLGLALVMKAVTLINGTIQLESEPGKGTAFTVKFNSGR